MRIRIRRGRRRRRRMRGRRRGDMRMGEISETALPGTRVFKPRTESDLEFDLVQRLARFDRDKLRMR